MLVGFQLGKLDEAKALEPVAAAAVARAGGTPALTGQLEGARGLIELARQRVDRDDAEGAAGESQGEQTVG